MGNFKEVSNNTLTQSLERRMKHIMVQLLNQFDDRFPSLEDSQEGRLFKFDIKNQFNDAIRATRDELRDYDIEYRPVRFNPDNTLSVAKAFIEGVHSITFNDLWPGMRIIARNEPQNLQIMHAIRRELKKGVVYQDESGSLVYDIYGLETCVDVAIPFMDLYRLVSDVQVEYANWRKKVIEQYSFRRQGNGQNI